MSQCHVTGTFYLPISTTVDPEPAPGVRLRVAQATAEGLILNSTAKIYTSDADGELDFHAPRLATIWLWADSQGFGRQQTGVAVEVPNTPVGTLEIMDGLPVITGSGANRLLLMTGDKLLLQGGGFLNLQE